MSKAQTPIDSDFIYSGMPNDSSGFFRSLSSYANEWIETKRKNLQAKPQTQVDRSGGYSIGFSKQQITQSELREVRRMRESGGLIATAFHSKALIKFGGGVEFQAEDDELENWLEDTLDGIDNLILDMGEDALWYPYSLGEIVETRTGDFSHIECIEPWTMLPETDEYGDIVRWQQKLQGGQTDIFQPEEIGSIILNKASGRDKTGISEALRNREEIEAFRAYQKSIREVDERIGFPFRHVKAGRDGGAQLNDQQLRRIRNRTNDIGAGETLTTGKDIEIDHENPMEGVDTSNIQERNMRMLATALGLPIELLNEGSDGLGSGMPAELRKELLALQNEADRRRIDDQFTEQFLRPIVKQYSDFDHTQDMGLTIAPFLDKKRDMAELISSVGEYMTTNEVREKLDMAPVDDDEMGESYRSPADQEEPEDEGGPGLFRQARALSVPDNAVSISDRSEAPDGASIVTGPGGGLYYVPAGEEPEGATQTPEQTQQEVADIVQSGNMAQLESHVADKMGVNDIVLPSGLSDEEATRLGSTLAYAGESGITGGIREVRTTDGGGEAFFSPQDRTLNINPNISEENMEGWRDDGTAAGDDLEWLMLHEIGHAEALDELSIEQLAEYQEQPLSETPDGEYPVLENMHLVEDEVGEYAKSSVSEFLAETYSGLAQGEEYSDDLMELYEGYGGSDSWREYRGESNE